MNAVRLSLDTAISDLFLLAAIVGVVGLVVVLFLREDPLRRTHAHRPGERRRGRRGRGRAPEARSRAGADGRPEPQAEPVA